MASIENTKLDAVADEVRNLISEVIEVPPEQIRGDSSFANDLGVDSLMALEIVAAIEKRYRIQIPEERLQQVKTLNDTIALARQYIGGQLTA
jgi:acyl carrier protein